MKWIYIYEILYLLVLTAVCIYIIYNTRSGAKTLAYLLFAIFVPFFGMFFYFSFGINYRTREKYSKKLVKDDELWQEIKNGIQSFSAETYYSTEELNRPDKRLTRYLAKELSPLSSGNNAVLLTNGEEKFPAVLQALEEATHHIHIEYYIYENDSIGRAIEEVLIRKAKEGVEVRFIYDDFGSRSIRKNIARRLRAAGVQAYPFYKIKIIALANRLNYRNHRKIIVIDGKKAFVGGINISDRYINKPGNNNNVFWRDTHLMLDGPAVLFLQYLFISDWNFCAGQYLTRIYPYFPDFLQNGGPGKQLVQFAASGPDSSFPTILYSLLFAIFQAKEELLITTPYFIPEQSIIDALVVASLGGVTVKLLVPKKSDSKFVDLAAFSYYDDLLAAGVQIYFYTKGFVHAKTLVSDRKISMVGTANLDFRSFDLNFEVNAIIYGETCAQQLADVFEADIKDAYLLSKEKWRKRPMLRVFFEKIARLVSPLL